MKNNKLSLKVMLKNTQNQPKKDDKAQINDNMSISQHSYFGPSKQQYECQWNPNICITAKNDSNLEAFDESQIQTNQNIRTANPEQQRQLISFIYSDQTIPTMRQLLQVSEQLIMGKICQKHKHNQNHQTRTKSENVINRRQNLEKNFLDSKLINKELRNEKYKMFSHKSIKQIHPKYMQHKNKALQIFINGQVLQKSFTPTSQQSIRCKSMSPAPNKVRLFMI
ncbi:unnamed protein product (macronuclear) [Paramecium tetraurelia]|uniref:Uncharacterized protein n=1 Tax=Paramecium tetraurelia TaxID=5888 RepID=A0E972_PARTE|nr:uncharacterized protein GSPATT00024570001 [Paramecium tetraurelia]CAK91839.1 unnamed protein product [Paramecium tetraurelia]|eukprot:XP_001459236.1 hypothetical protein (macronuclear) [Paramecium tetraurelia strain d4-2]